MNASTFKKDLERMLLGFGFRRDGKSLRRDQSGVSVLVSFDKGFGKQWLGFWLLGLDELKDARVERTHLYFRLERLLPASREVILTAGHLGDEAQAQAYETLLRLLAEDADALLRTLGTEDDLRRAMRSSELSGRGFIRKDARAYLEA
jgi:hypothetical protein